MMRDHQNMMRREAGQQAVERAGTRIGTISGYDATNFMAKVMLQPDGTETGWLPIGTVGVGNGWGIQVGPSIGDMVAVEFQDGGIDAGVITQRFFNDQARPGAVPGGEVWLVHQGGQFIKLLADGSISSSGTWNHAGAMNVTGTLTATVDVVGGGKSLKTHTHLVTAVGAQTNPTT
jgi:hypothetical protein